ncbi:GntR family transcriptional regulator [Novosphingobium sp. G106]|uniref:GntR family transcriptional regulator n=1 Tax=Novosphingobium sp. G106 TaxID=2849500 RepID=UPI001C2DC5C3|nr:GntR family transcriptional regulator [Novosphingobium sp. G106]MBV1686109.1 GntR family transcriptional regulator [Novosphingobium sp. G106]
MTEPFELALDRSARTPLAEQIRCGIVAAIEGGVLEPGARLPSWQDLAAQLGVARGTVRTAYEKLSAAQLIEASRAAGTRVARRPRAIIHSATPPDEGGFIGLYQEMTQGPALFQMGIPATDTFPATLFTRLRAQSVRAEASSAPLYPDPRGELELRREIAGYLAVARGDHLPAVPGLHHGRLLRRAWPRAQRPQARGPDSLVRRARLSVVPKGP